jgi:hypothetical protein
MSYSLYVLYGYEGDIDITKDILYETELYCNILKYGKEGLFTPHM